MCTDPHLHPDPLITTKVITDNNDKMSGGSDPRLPGPSPGVSHVQLLYCLKFIMFNIYVYCCSLYQDSRIQDWKSMWMEQIN